MSETLVEKPLAQVRKTKALTSSGTCRRMTRRKLFDKCFFRLCQFTVLIALLSLVLLIGHILYQGLNWLSFDFFTHFTSRFAHQAGIKASIFGSVWVLALTTFFAVPLGVSAAIFLEEYAPKKNG